MSIKQIEYLKWIGTALFITAAVLLSANVSISPYGFFLFLTGHALLAYLFFRDNDKPMFTQNFIFLFVDAFGIYRWFIA
jgi:hypothetical protein